MRRRFTNPRVISYTMPVYEHRNRTWLEQWEYNRRVNKNINELLGIRDLTIHIIIVISLAIILGGVVAGFLLVG